MEIKVVSNQSDWDGWLKGREGASFLQSFGWGEILLGEGEEVERLAFYEGDQRVGQAQIVIKTIKSGVKYVFCPYGPVVESCEKEIYQEFGKYLKEKNYIFGRIEPFKRNNEIDKMKLVEHINPSITSVLDLTQSEDEILENAKKNTRYSIKTSLKQGLQLKTEKNFDVFWQLMNMTASRDEFRVHNKKHYEMVLNSEMSYQLTAYFEDKPVASAIIIGFDDTFNYIFAASDHELRQYLATYFIQWEAFKLGKKLGFAKYDFFGIAPNTAEDGEYSFDEKHNYAGITRFKIGFGGEVVERAGTFDIVIDRIKYQIIHGLKKFRRIFR